jgi:hypothetical protein
MSNEKIALSEMMTLDGAQCTALVDANSGMMLASLGSGVDLEMAAAGNTEVVRAKLKTMATLGIKDHIEDILITLGSAYHIITLVQGKQGLFLYTVLDKSRSNLAMARRKAADIARTLSV